MIVVRLHKGRGGLMNNPNIENGLTTFVGIDVSKRTLDVGNWSGQTLRTFNDEAKGLRGVMSFLPTDHV